MSHQDSVRPVQPRPSQEGGTTLILSSGTITATSGQDLRESQLGTTGEALTSNAYRDRRQRRVEVHEFGGGTGAGCYPRCAWRCYSCCSWRMPSRRHRYLG